MFVFESIFSLFLYNENLINLYIYTNHAYHLKAIFALKLTEDS